MSLLIDGSSPAVVTGTPTTTTASFTPPSGSTLLIAFSGNTTTATNPSVPTITDNLGTPLTYTLAPNTFQSRAIAPNVDGQVAMWTAPVVIGAAMTVSVTNHNTGVADKEGAVKVWVVTGADVIPVGTSGSSGSTSASSIAQLYTATATSGQGFIVTCDWDLVGNETAGSGCTADGVGSIPTRINYGFFRRTLDDDTNGSSMALNVNLPGTSTNLSWAYVELVPTFVNPTVEDPPPFQITRPPGIIAPNYWKNPWLGTPPGRPLRTTPATPISVTQSNWTATGASATTASVSWNAGDFIVVLGATADQSATLVPTATGLTLLAGTPLTTASSCWANSWTCVAPSTSSSIFTATKTGTTTPYGIAVWVFRGSDGLGARAVDTSTTKVVALPTLDAHSRAVEILADFTAGAITSRVWTPSGQTEEQALVVSGQYTVFVADWPDQGQPANLNYGISGTASVGVHTKIALEIYGSFGSAIPDQNITPTGSPPDERFGVAVTSPGDATVSPTGATTNEAFGSATVSSTVTISPTGISSNEVFGSPTVSIVTTISPTGVPSNEQFGSATVSTTYTIAPTGIKSDEAFGSPAVTSTFTIAPTGIRSDEKFGSPLVTVAQTISPTGIFSDEKFGSPSVSVVQTISPTGVASDEKFGSAAVTPGAVTISPTGTRSDERFGSPTVSATVTISPTGISSNEQFGSPTTLLVTTISPTGVQSDEKFGSVTLTASNTISPSGVRSDERFGSATVTSSYTIAPTGVPSSEVFGTPSILLVTTISPTGVPSGEAFGSPTVSVSAAGITPTGTPSDERFGSPTISAGAVTVSPTGIPPTEAFGTPTILLVTTISPTGISSDEKFGSATVSSTFSVTPVGVKSDERFGSITISTGAVTVAPTGIRSDERFGVAVTLTGTLPQTVSPTGIRSNEAFGQTSTYRQATVYTSTGTMVISVSVYTPVVNTDSVAVAHANADIATKVINTDTVEPLH